MAVDSTSWLGKQRAEAEAAAKASQDEAERNKYLRGGSEYARGRTVSEWDTAHPEYQGRRPQAAYESDKESYIERYQTQQRNEQLYSQGWQRNEVSFRIQQQEQDQAARYRQQAEINVQQRPGYYQLQDLGDVQTQRTLKMIEQANVALSIAGMPTIGLEAAAGGILETQRQIAYKTPTTKDEQFYGTELSKWAQRPVEQASAYHDIGMKAGVTIPENPYEMRADLAVEFLKGEPHKRSERFSPVSGKMTPYLPGGQGLQETMWDTAVAYERGTQTPAPVSYLDAVNVLSTTRGGLFTGEIGHPTTSPEMITKTRTVAGQAVEASGKSLTNIYDLYSTKKSEFEALSKQYEAGGRTDEAAYTKLVTLQDQLTVIGKGVYGADIVQAEMKRYYLESLPRPYVSQVSIEDKTKQIEFSPITAALAQSPIGGPAAAFTYQTFGTESGRRAMEDVASTISKGDIFAAYEKLNRVVAPVSTDYLGIGRRLEQVPELKERIGIQTGTHFVGIMPEVVNFGKGYISELSQSPIDVALMIGLGGATRGTEQLWERGIAKAAMSETKGVTAIGKMLSTPTASDVMTIGKTGLAAYFVGTGISEAAGKPTYGEKGEAFGKFTAQMGGFALGYTTPKFERPINIYQGREFFSGKPAMGPFEKSWFKGETFIRSLMTENAEAYRDVAAIMPSGRWTEPTIKKEPRLEDLSRAGEYALEIRETLIEQPHSMFGSGAVRNQYQAEMLEKWEIRFGKDVDAYAYKPSEAYEKLTDIAKIDQAKAESVMDLHPIPRNYPGLPESAEVDTKMDTSSLFSKIFGDPYRNIAFPRGASEVVYGGKSYKGEITYEMGQVQFGRKAQAVAADIYAPFERGYRLEKDVYDYISLYFLQKELAISKGAKPESFAKYDIRMEEFLSKEVTYNPSSEIDRSTTRAFREIYEGMKSRKPELKLTLEPVERGSLSAFPSLSIFSGIPSVASSVIIDMPSPSFKSVISKSPSPVSIKSSPSIRSPSPSLSSPSIISSSPPSISPPSISPSRISSPPISSPPSVSSPSISIIPSISPPSISPPSLSPPSYSPSPSITPPTIETIKIMYPNIGVGDIFGPGNFGLPGPKTKKYRYQNPIVDLPYLSGLAERYTGSQGKSFGLSKKKGKGNILDEFGM